MGWVLIVLQNIHSQLMRDAHLGRRAVVHQRDDDVNERKRKRRTTWRKRSMQTIHGCSLTAAVVNAILCGATRSSLDLSDRLGSKTRSDSGVMRRAENSLSFLFPAVKSPPPPGVRIVLACRIQSWLLRGTRFTLTLLPSWAQYRLGWTSVEFTHHHPLSLFLFSFGSAERSFFFKPIKIKRRVFDWTRSTRAL